MPVIMQEGTTHTVVVQRRATVATVVAKASAVKVASSGPQGPAGAPGPAGAGYTHDQPSAAATWTIAHNLGYRPAVELYDSGSQEINADIAHLDANTVRVSFVVPIAGFARLN